MNLISRITMIAALSTSAVAFAGSHGTPNCDVGGKKIHVKSKEACEKKKGTFSEDKAAPAKDSVKPTEQKSEQKPDVQVAPAPEVKK